MGVVKFSRVERPTGVPNAIGISRRGVLKGALGSAAASMLITLHEEEAGAEPNTRGPTLAADNFWLFGAKNGAEGYALEGIRPDAASLASVRDANHATVRTPDGATLVDVSSQANANTAVRTFSAATGAPDSLLLGSVSWPAETDMAVAVSPGSRFVAASGLCFTTEPDGGTYSKRKPGHPTLTRQALRYRAYQAVELFDLAKGRVVASGALGEVHLGSTYDVAVADSGEVSIFEHGPEGTNMHTLAGDSMRVQETTKLGHTVTPLALNVLGHTYMLAGETLFIRSPDGEVRTVDMNLGDFERHTARPFMPSVIRTGENTLAYVDTSRAALLSIDAFTGGPIRSRRLQTSRDFRAGSGSQSSSPAAHIRESHIFVPDGSGTSGGIWVHDAKTLEVLDRWHSDVPFDLVWVSPTSGTVFGRSVEGPVAVHRSSGELVGFVPSSVQTARAL